MNICLFSKEEAEGGFKLNIKDDRANHLVKILHKKVGDSFIAGIIDGNSGVATIKSIDDEYICCEFSENADKDSCKPLNPIKMIIGFPRPIQLKRLLRDIAALGVCEVHLTGTELGEKSYMQSTLVEKGNAYKMLLDGTVQAGSTHVPELFLHQTLKECLNFLEADNSSSLKIALDNINPTDSLNNVLKNKKNDNISSVVAAIGSERGWTDKERNLLESFGYIRSGMGERIMRTETAATVAGALIIHS
jgi:RsmE family RNA methyltransferase